jgi:hypothetical protein
MYEYLHLYYVSKKGYDRWTCPNLQRNRGYMLLELLDQAQREFIINLKGTFMYDE